MDTDLKWMNEKIQSSNSDVESIISEVENLVMDGRNNQVLLLPKQQHHPELEDLYIMDLLGGDRIIAGEPYLLDCDMFSGTLLVMCRTSDADSSSTKPLDATGTALNHKYSNYFRNKQRRFEFQLQIKFKQAPPSRLFFQCQLDDPIKLGVVQRAFVAATLNFIEKKNHGGFFFNVPGKEPKPEELLKGSYEKPHITFAAEKAFDRLVVTKQGEVPQTLGTEIHEDSEAIKFNIELAIGSP